MQTTDPAHIHMHEAPPTPSAPLGRPTLCTPQLLAALLAAIRAYGFSDSAAAARLGVAPSTLSRWKSRDPDLQLQLAAAREAFRTAQLELLLDARTRDGRPDWRAAAWLLQHVFPEDYGGRRAHLPPTAALPDEFEGDSAAGSAASAEPLPPASARAPIAVAASAPEAEAAHATSVSGDLAAACVSAPHPHPAADELTLPSFSTTATSLQNFRNPATPPPAAPLASGILPSPLTIPDPFPPALCHLHASSE